MRHPMFTNSGHLREMQGMEFGDSDLSPWDPELQDSLELNQDWETEETDDPLLDWIETDMLTIIDHPHITACGSVVGFNG